jgi:uncharacterized membrane protein YdjX (TVP38/TMEM64 family)
MNVYSSLSQHSDLSNSYFSDFEIPSHFDDCTDIEDNEEGFFVAFDLMQMEPVEIEMEVMEDDREILEESILREFGIGEGDDDDDEYDIDREIGAVGTTTNTETSLNEGDLSSLNELKKRTNCRLAKSIWHDFSKLAHNSFINFTTCPWSTSGYLRFFVAIAMIALVIGSFYFFLNADLFTSFFEWIKKIGWYGYLIVLVLLVLTQLPFSYGYVLIAMACGFVYEIVIGFALVSIGTMLGLPVAYYLTDKVLRSWIERRIEKSLRLRALVYASKKNGFKISIFVRLLPVPVGVISGLLCVANIKFLDYYIGSLIGLLPEMFFYVLIGTGANNLLMIAQGKLEMSLVEKIFTAFVVISTIVLSVVMAYFGRKEVNKAMREMETVENEKRIADQMAREKEKEKEKEKETEMEKEVEITIEPSVNSSSLKSISAPTTPTTPTLTPPISKPPITAQLSKSSTTTTTTTTTKTFQGEPLSPHIFLPYDNK